MLKRIMLTLLFVAAFSAAGLCLTNQAEARWYRWGRPYVSYYYAPRPYYGYDTPYRTYYRGYYAPRSYYYNPYAYGNYNYYRPVPRMAVQVGPLWR